MYNRLIGLPVVAFVVAMTTSPAISGEYSGPGFAADIVIRDPRLGSGKYHGRYYFDRGGYRMEIDGRSRVKTFVFNSFHRYSVSIGASRRVDIKEDKAGTLSMLFGDAPCAGFRTALKVGSDAQGGREVQVWRCDKPRQELLDGGYAWDHRETVWYDQELRHFVRLQSNDGVNIELKSITPGRQAPSLFNIPTESGPVKATARIAEVESVD